MRLRPLLATSLLALSITAASPIIPFSAAHAEEDIPVADTTIIPGVRVGPIQMGTTLFGLKTIYGGGKVKAAKISGPEGSEFDGATLFKDTDKELEILFNEEGDEREITSIRIIGKAWKFNSGLKLGMSVAEVEKINGKPFLLNGFGWDYGGTANFTGGKLENKVMITFDPGENDYDDSLAGDRQIPSTNKKLRATPAKVSQITVSFYQEK